MFPARHATSPGLRLRHCVAVWDIERGTMTYGALCMQCMHVADCSLFNADTTHPQYDFTGVSATSKVSDIIETIESPAQAHLGSAPCSLATTKERFWKTDIHSI